MTIVRLTGPADRAAAVRGRFDEDVVRWQVLRAAGMSAGEITAHCAARRWQRNGQAVILHSGPLTERQRASVALANVGSRGALTSFTSLAEAGLRGWARLDQHVLVPVGARVHRPDGIRIVAHQTPWAQVRLVEAGRRHRVEDAAALAADSFDTVRPAAGLFAALVQQRLVTATTLREVVRARSRHRHRGVLLHVLDDIAMGAEALSELDFAGLCRALGLPEPTRQSFRVDSQGRKRYLDVEWALAGGRKIVVEIDGALHLQVDRFWEDMYRQNDVVLDRVSTVLRFPSVAARTRDPRLVDQLRRALR